MRKANQLSLKQAIEAYLDETGMKQKLLERKAIHAWEKLMGNMIAKRTEKIYIKDNRLFIKLSSSAVRQELSYGKEKIIRMMNEEVGTELISEVILM